MSNLVQIENRDFAFENRLSTFSIVNRGHIDVKSFFADAFEHFQSQIYATLDTQYIIKVAVCFRAIFEKRTVTSENEEKVERQEIYLHSSAEIVDFETPLREYYNESIVEYIEKRIEAVELRGSGFTLSEIVELNVQISSFAPYAGCSYVQTPKKLNNKKAIINIKNFDEKCFMWAILSAIYPAVKNPQRVSKYEQYKDELNFDDINFPVTVKDISKFEKQNSEISINVYLWQSDKVVPVRLTKKVKTKHVHLLLICKENKDISLPDSYHYCWIKNLSALLGQQISSNCTKKIFCDRCLNHFTALEKLEKHRVACALQNEFKIEMPEEGSKIKFEAHRKQIPVPFIVYADVESILKPPSEQPFCKTDKSIAYQEHEVFSIGYYELNVGYRSNRGPNCIDWFVREMARLARNADDYFNHNQEPLQMSMEDEVLFGWAEECHICQKTFLEGQTRVRDHCHRTGKFRGAAHQACNVVYQEARYIPIVFHNLSNYDSHFLIRAFANNIEGDISVIPKNDQVYISFSKTVTSAHGKGHTSFIRLRFIDSLRFMTSSLDHLSSLLPSENKNVLRHENRHLSMEQLQLLERKGVFPYDYIDSWSKLEETVLPSKEKFYSSLTDADISDDDYRFANQVWNGFNIATLGDYADLYMKTDILLLADVFENFRRTCQNIFKLDPAHYFTAPGLSFDAMLKFTNVEIELLTDVDMLLFIERGIRGGISQCSKRFSNANNKYMKDFDPETESKFLIYLDANNLYGYSMMKYLPISDFKWCEDVEQFTTESILNLSDESSVGYIFEVDLEYPQDLHDLHKDYPYCAERKNPPNTKNQKKLLLTLDDKKNYVIHYSMLKSALKQGLVLKKVHKAIQFKQSPWLKPYIDLNTELRTKATSEFEKNFFKLLINAIYGKTMENLRSRVDVSLKTKWDGRYGAHKLVASPNFKKFTIFDEHLAALELTKTDILMNKPIIVGMSILDISKVLMYDFYYDHLKKKYGENIEMLYTDTDSFILEVKTDCFYSDMMDSLEKYDTSDFAENNEYGMPRVNKKIPGLFKDEMNGKIGKRFAGLKSKMYCITTEDGDEIKKAKGLKKNVVRKTISPDDYMNCIMNNCTFERRQNVFRSFKHNVFTVAQSKVALSPSDNKRFVMDDNINTLPWGHYNIPIQAEENSDE